MNVWKKCWLLPVLLAFAIMAQMMASAPSAYARSMLRVGVHTLGDTGMAKEATERQYKALQHAFHELPDEFSRELIDKNLFRGIPMDYVVVPMSDRQKKRVRSGFIRALAEKLEEI